MKIKQKGVTTTAIAMIVIIVVAVAGIGAYFLTQEEKKPDEAALGITTTSLSGGVVDVAYSATLVASGGTSPYTWENIGSLPDGLSLSTAGTISGTPTTENDFSFTVKVTDSVENTATKALSIHVGAAAAALGITTTSLSDGVVDVAYSAPLVASGGTSPYTWSIVSGSLPDGLSLSTAGTISGTPTTENDFSFTVKVTDSVENTATKALSIHVEAAGEGPTGTATYTGTWLGTFTGTGDVSGAFQFTVNFDAGTVSGSFSGAASGNVTGTVSELTMDASGTAAWGLVTWSGDISSDGSSVTGTWDCSPYGISLGSGTWSGIAST